MKQPNSQYSRGRAAAQESFWVCGGSCSVRRPPVAETTGSETEVWTLPFVHGTGSNLYVIGATGPMLSGLQTTNGCLNWGLQPPRKDIEYIYKEIDSKTVIHKIRSGTGEDRHDGARRCPITIPMQ
jgi:hypothetical protein